MKSTELRPLAKDFLEPLISGARLDDGFVKSTARENLVALADPCTIHFKAEKEDQYRLILRRSQPFAPVRAGALTESDVVEAFAKVVNAMKNGLKKWYKADLRSTFPRRVVANALCNNKMAEESVLAAIDQLMAWSGQQYEGKPIPAAIGFIPGVPSGAVRFQQFSAQNFSPVLSNGFDTLLTCNFNGQVIGHETLPASATASIYTPYRLAAISEWAKDGRLAITLNRAGEILIFHNQKLRFARRAGQWHFLTHDPILTQMGRPDDYDVRKAVYETCLDASFARTGACIGIVISAHANEWKQTAVSHDDHVGGLSIKARLLTPIIANKPFQKLDRRLRQELVAIDGATLINHKGHVLAVGAILKIAGGSTGGGRLAAAKELSKLGVGIKVSQDGGIKGFHDGNDEPKFIVM